MAIIRGCAFPDDLAYDDALNLWFRDAGAGVWDVGITEFGLALSGEVYMFNPRPVGREVEAGRAFALIEVAKTVLSVRSPFDCTIVAVNDAVAQRPSLLNRDPYANWLCRLAAASPQSALDLLVRGDKVLPAATALMDLHQLEGPPADGPVASS